jgi:hypothetical protein
MIEVDAIRLYGLVGQRARPVVIPAREVESQLRDENAPLEAAHY